MRVGLLESRAARLPGYWAAYLKELGATPVTPAVSDAQALELGRESLPGEPATVQLALGRILGLPRVDMVLVPQWAALNGDTWSQALPELLSRRISGLPTLISVPDQPGALENAAAEVGLRVAQTAGPVRRALEKVRPLSQDARMAPATLSRASRATVAVIGPRALLGEHLLTHPLRTALDDLGLYGVFNTDLSIPEVLRRAERMPGADTAAAGDLELFGATSLLGGKGAVRGFVFAVPARDGAAHAAAGRLAAAQHKPTLLLALDGQSDFPDLTAFRDRVTLGRFAPATAEEAGEGGA